MTADLLGSKNLLKHIPTHIAPPTIASERKSSFSKRIWKKMRSLALPLYFTVRQLSPVPLSVCQPSVTRVDQSKSV